MRVRADDTEHEVAQVGVVRFEVEHLARAGKLDRCPARPVVHPLVGDDVLAA